MIKCEYENLIEILKEWDLSNFDEETKYFIFEQNKDAFTNKRKYISEENECYIKRIVFFEILEKYLRYLEDKKLNKLVEEINKELKHYELKVKNAKYDYEIFKYELYNAKTGNLIFDKGWLYVGSEDLNVKTISTYIYNDYLDFLEESK